MDLKLAVKLNKQMAPVDRKIMFKNVLYWKYNSPSHLQFLQ